MSIIPNAQQPGSKNAGLYAILVLAALLAGEYYVLTTPAKKAPQTAGKVEVPVVTPALKSKNEASLKKRHSLSTQPKVKVTPATNSPTPEGLGAMSAGMDGKMASIEDGVVEKARAFYKSFGLLIRALLVVVAIILVFVQGPPKEKAGVRRPKVKRQQIKRLVYGLSAVMVPVSMLVLFVHHLSLEQMSTVYPAGAGGLLMLGFMAGMLRGSLKAPDFGLRADPIRIETEYGLVFKTDLGEYINVPNPDRGILVLGGAGAGKSFSIGEPLIEQFALKYRAGLIYDYKFPDLAQAAQKALILAEPTMKQYWEKAAAHAKKAGTPVPKPLRHHIINFLDMSRTERVNPFRAQDMPDISYAQEYAQTIISNLGGSDSGGENNFFSKSAYAFFTSIIWFYRNNYPQFCTIPHVVATALYPELSAVLSMLQADIQSADMAQSLMVATEGDAGRQLAGVVASLQVDLVRINTPNIAWVLTPDEDQGEGFSLNLNDPLAPKLLTIGNNATLEQTFSPVIACIVATALKLMNQQDKQPSYVFLDEAATIFIPNLETIPATARSNRVCLAYMTQDLAQMTLKYGEHRMKVMIANLNIQFLGKTNNLDTAKFTSEMIGRVDREMVSVSAGKNQGGKGGGGSSLNNSVSLQERNLVRPQDVITLERGEFIGQTVETNQPFFQGTIVREIAPGKYPIQPFATYEYGEAETERLLIEKNNERRAREAKQTLNNNGPSIFARRRAAVVENTRRTKENEEKATNATEAIILRNFQMIRDEVAAIVTSFPDLVKQQKEEKQEAQAAMRQATRRAAPQV